MLAKNEAGTPLSESIRFYDTCFGEFLNSAHNGQKHMQAILLREAFRRFQEQDVGLQKDAATSVLDVSCGPGEYSTMWTTHVAKFLPQGMRFFCTDFPGGTCKDGEKYTTATARKIAAKGAAGLLKLASEPAGVEANLFSGAEPIIPEGEKAHVIHWSHSGYHVRDALGDKKNDEKAIQAGLNTAVDKMWAALQDDGLVFSIHQTNDLSDGTSSEMFPTARKYLGVLDDVPKRIGDYVRDVKKGYVATVNFATPLEFPNMPDSRWEALKDPAKWDYLDANQARALRLLGFIAYDYSDPDKSGLEKLAEVDAKGGELGLRRFVDDYKNIVKKNGGHITVKCAFQMMCKSPEVARKLEGIAEELRKDMPRYMDEMDQEMEVAAGKTRLFRKAYQHRHDTFDTDRFVEAANAHIDQMYAQGKRVGDSFFHALAVHLKRTNIGQRNGGPFGAIIVDSSGDRPRVIGVGGNHVVPNHDPSAHAEMEAYRDAAKRTGSSDLKGAELFTSCECCPMCLSVANACGIKRISYVNTRRQAADIGFSDELQYDIFKLPREQQMTEAGLLGAARVAELEGKLGKHGAVVLNDKGEVFATGDAASELDPTGTASINAVRSAVRKHAEAVGGDAPVFCLPEGFTLLCRDIPHPAGLIAADWARMLRKRDPAHPDDPAFDSRTPIPERIVHLTNCYEQLPVGKGTLYQDAELTYRQPVLPDEERAVKTEQFRGAVIPNAAKEVFETWKRSTGVGEQVRY